MPFREKASRTASLNPGIGWPSAIEIISRPSHPALAVPAIRKFARSISSAAAALMKN
jgi:hypothetical protein